MITRPKRDRHTDVAELMRLRVDHDRAGAREDERERPDRLGDERRARAGGGHSGRSSATSGWTRASISSRIRRTAVEVLAGRIVELPVLVPLAGIDRAGVAAAHRDHDVGGADDLVA